MFSVDYADNGSVLRCYEEQTYIYFMDFLEVRHIINALLLYNVTITHWFCLLQKRTLNGAPWKIYVYFFWSQLSPTNKLAQKTNY